jgi:hypothetical protein
MALSADMSYWINSLIFNKLGDICPMISLNGEDRKVYEMCVKDFKDYLTYLEVNRMKVDNSQTLEYTGEIPQIVADEFVQAVLGIHEEIQNKLKDSKEMAEFVNVWVQWWWRKWQERTKVIFGEMPKGRIGIGTPFPSGEFTAEEREDIQRATIDKLIQYGEICCPSILADALFRKEVQASERTEWKMQDKINLISRLQRCAREMSYTHGPLVFIKPSKEFWGLREWRDDNANKVI